MYRYCVDEAITYTSEDLVLFRESPFACWMERLTLENPDHGIPPDLGSRPPGNSMERQDELAETLRAEGKRVALVDWDEAEPERRRLTLDAMRKGQDFIVNGQLALGPLSGSSNLLMRTSGYSELGGYLYLPCDTQVKTTIHSAFRLCFLADLLHSLQGQLPGQMLIIRGDSDLLPLTTEDHIYHYRAVKQRFMSAMRDFRKHRMPDPAESSHFGRWSECANEVMRQRALREAGAEAEEVAETQSAGEASLPELIAAVASGDAAAAQAEVVPQNPLQARLSTSRGLEVNDTLVAQARALQSELAPQASSAAPTSATASRRTLDSALENLSFIGRQPSVGKRRACPSSTLPGESPAPEPTGPSATPERASPPDFPPSHPTDSECFSMRVHSSPGESTAVDRDEAAPELRQVHPAELAAEDMEMDCIDDSDYRLPGEPPVFDEPGEALPPAFSSSLNTAGSDPD